MCTRVCEDTFVPFRCQGEKGFAFSFSHSRDRRLTVKEPASSCTRSTSGAHDSCPAHREDNFISASDIQTDNATIFTAFSAVNSECFVVNLQFHIGDCEEGPDQNIESVADA